MVHKPKNLKESASPPHVGHCSSLRSNQRPWGASGGKLSPRPLQAVGKRKYRHLLTNSNP
ncbi:hypothetical protein H1P_6900002 [Hyella patelloides LEGE 07179]|uniref:Uncharacterized protein n=1 Tax=Hyella patelloides LEGE 07179 TaxID=945734 RepID=A0A563W328_9CYAN|nr:hypothetical protein H1P_6900002 [Hyella patelloides LEGE 07179]